ncbi:MAG: tetratricopeptide repeat protein [Gammaproteobacteria bacterium]|nr:MAG: tetratricopeptide repeat protein [Gammaproteobacteria bacterium]
MQSPSLQNDSLLQADLAQISLATPQPNSFSDDAYHLLVAELAIMRGQTDLAVQNYLSVARSQNNPEIAERAVRIAVYGQNLEAATEAAQRWVELAPDQVEARQTIVAIYIRQDKADKAFQYLDDIIDTSEMSEATLFSSLLSVLSREKNITTVLSVTHRIAQKHPERAHAQFLHGMLAAQGDKSVEALEYLDRALAIQDIEGAHNARANLLLKLGLREEAVISLYQAVLATPDNQKLRLTYARLLVDVRQYEKARVEFEILHQASPQDADLLYSLGLLSLESQRLDDAEKFMLKLVQMNQREGESQYYLGRINEGLGRYRKAIDWYRQVHVSEYLFDAKLHIADLLGKTGQYGEAHDYLDAMLKGSQSNGSLVRIYLGIGELLRSETRYEEAVEVYTTALGIVPGNTDLLYSRGLVAERIGRIDILEQDILEILKTEPNNAHALNVLGYTLADQTDRYQEAHAYLKRAIEIRPEDAAIIDSLGWVNYRLGNYDEAIRLLRRALSRFDDSEIAAHLGEVLWVSGAQGEARSVWQRALRKVPDDPLLQQTMHRFIQ